MFGCRPSQQSDLKIRFFGWLRLGGCFPLMFPTWSGEPPDSSRFSTPASGSSRYFSLRAYLVLRTLRGVNSKCSKCWKSEETPKKKNIYKSIQIYPDDPSCHTLASTRSRWCCHHTWHPGHPLGCTSRSKMSCCQPGAPMVQSGWISNGPNGERWPAFEPLRTQANIKTHQNSSNIWSSLIFLAPFHHLHHFTSLPGKKFPCPRLHQSHCR